MLTFSNHNLVYVLIKTPEGKEIKVYVTKNNTSIDAPLEYDIELITRKKVDALRLHQE